MFAGIALNLVGQLKANFTPASLFANSEPGVWYDTSDISTLFQDTEGTTPVTAPGQTVALALDKSQGLTLGPEEFEAASASEASGVVQDGTSNNWTMTSAPPNNGAIVYNAGFSANAGKTYSVSFEVYDYVSGEVAGRLQGVNGPSVSANGTYEYKHLALGTGDFIGVVILSTATLKIRNISVRELPGYHATQPTAAARPTYQVDGNGRGYLSFDGVDDFLETSQNHPFTYTDPMCVFAGFRKIGTTKLYETLFSAGTTTNSVANSNRSMGFLITSDNLLTTDIWKPSGVKGSTVMSSPYVGVAYWGISNWSTHRTSGDTVVRLNGVAETVTLYGAENPVSLNTGTMKIGVFDTILGTSYFNGQLYSLITRFGPNLTTPEIEQVEGYVNSKTGAY